jgi:hypothetical protein
LTSEDFLQIGAQFTESLCCIEHKGVVVFQVVVGDDRRGGPLESEYSERGACIYHAQAGELGSEGMCSPKSLPLERFEKEGASEQSSLFLRPNDGKSSIDKGCACVSSDIFEIYGVE